MASEVNFAQFKAKVDKSLSEGFDRGELAEIFLGGTSPKTLASRCPPRTSRTGSTDWTCCCRECAGRLLSEAFLYNSIKHGLSPIALDESTQIANRSPDGEKVVCHRGPMFAYMHKPRRPGVKSSDREWFIERRGRKDGL